ncbi:MAG: Rab family GTPase [Gemmatimonadaceae bacterium]
MIQKKICMVGVFGTGKTCLVQQYVHSIFSVKYLSTVGVKIDKKEVQVGGQKITLMLWDLEGRDGTRDVSASYARGAHGVIYVADGTRRDTLDQIDELREIVSGVVGDIPSVVAVNKVDLVEQWQLTEADEEAVGARGLQRFRTSAKTGKGVEETFQWLAEATLASAQR